MIKRSLLCLMLFSTPILAANCDKNDYTNINVVGHYEAFAQADMVSLTFEIAKYDNDSSSLQNYIDQKSNEIVTAIKNLPYNSSINLEVGTFSYNKNLDKDLSYKGNYVGRRSISIMLYDINKLPDILDSILKIKGIESLYNVKYDIKDKDSIIKQAMQKALENGQNQAISIAKAMGLDLKRVCNISYYDNNLRVHAISLAKRGNSTSLDESIYEQQKIPVNARVEMSFVAD